MLDSVEEDAALPGDAAASGPPLKARLKWFNMPKGFGFVIPEDDESCDAFLHITTLQKNGVNALGDGACLMCHIQRGPRGAHVTHVVSVLDPGAIPEQLCDPRNSDSPPIGKTLKMGGQVKWYKADKGFGFIIPDDGMKDVFIHKTCLEKNGISHLTAGQRVSMLFKIVPKGREVITIKVGE